MQHSSYSVQIVGSYGELTRLLIMSAWRRIELACLSKQRTRLNGCYMSFLPPTGGWEFLSCRYETQIVLGMWRTPSTEQIFITRQIFWWILILWIPQRCDGWQRSDVPSAQTYQKWYRLWISPILDTEHHQLHLQVCRMPLLRSVLKGKNVSQMPEYRTFRITVDCQVCYMYLFGENSSTLGACIWLRYILENSTPNSELRDR